jgi:hypothetical protein
MECSSRNVMSVAEMKARPCPTSWQTRGKKLTRLAQGLQRVSDLGVRTTGVTTHRGRQIYRRFDVLVK